MELIKRSLILNDVWLHLKKLVWLILLPALCACSPGTSFKPASEFPRDTTILDFRQSSLIDSAAIPEYQDAFFIKQAVYGTGFPDTLHVGIPVKGHFTGTSETQSVYLITRTDMRRAMLAVFSHAPDASKSGDKTFGRIMGQFVLDEPYMQLLGVQDINEDGFDELILLQDAFQMGVHLQSIEIMSIANMQRTLVAKEQFVLENSCASAQHENVIRASRLEFSSRSILRDDFVADCVDDDDAAEPMFKLAD